MGLYFQTLRALLAGLKIESMVINFRRNTHVHTDTTIRGWTIQVV